MKKIFFYLLLLLALPVSAQYNLATNGIVASSIVPYDADAQAYFNKLSALGYSAPSATMKGYYNTFFKNLKTGTVNGTNVFSKLDRLWWRGSEVQLHNLVSLVNPSSTLAEEKNSIGNTWTQYQGYAPNGVDMYIDTHFNASTDGVNYVQNSATAFIYSRTDLNGFKVDYGGANAAFTIVIQIDPREGNSFYCSVNDNSSEGGKANANSLGLQLMTRTSSSNINVYNGTTLLGSETVNSTGIPNLNIYESCRNYNGTAQVFSTRNILCGGFAASLTANEEADLYAAIQAFATSLGVQV